MPTTTDRRLAAAWETYRERIPATAPLEQFQQLRDAFYSGAASVLALTVELADPSLTDDEARAALQALTGEALEFWEEAVDAHDRRG
jgi:hypothetical protein